MPIIINFFRSDSTTSGITCSANFFFENASDLCRPECGEWSQYKQTAEIAIYSINITIAVAIIAVAIATLVLSYIRRKTM